jgi:hypothetical protein
MAILSSGMLESVASQETRVCVENGVEIEPKKDAAATEIVAAGQARAPSLHVLIWLLLFRFFLCQSDFRGIQLLLNFGKGFTVLFCRNGFVPLLHRTLPMSGSQFEATGFLVEIA